ncbi:cache domain-containing sensor histidine kinase [Paenibacillus nasutitermitis]|uniref:Sensor histidine kinase YesM n=1 Tax=Paenibacillus nasutitermitis TaxID=1652958 RepID=A0A916YNM9_9BACL|nr:sensor histidine kinase [Paenibacillus nasutitermitis]GGD53351.1 sensor histidine kinase YesM [Paenibacillus nasutitermitis]
MGKTNWRVSYRNWNLDKKLILMYTLMILLPMLVVTFLGFQRYNENMKDKVSEFSLELLNQLGKNLDNYLNEVERISLSFSMDAGVQQALLPETNDSPANRFNDKKLIDKALMNIVLVPFKDVIGTYLFKPSGEIFSRYSSNRQADYSQFQQERWYREALTADGKGIYLPTYALQSIDGREELAFTFLRSMINIPKNQSAGVFRIDLNLNSLSSIFSNVLGDTKQELYIVDQQGNIVYDRNRIKITEKFPLPLDKEFDSFIFRADGKETMVNYITTQVSGWKIANVIPVSELTHNIEILRNLLWTLTIVALILSIGLSVFLTRRLLLPLKKMKSLMNKVEDGDYTVQFKVQSSDEIGRLATSFNIMVKRINELVHNVFAIRILKREADFKVLQSKINPHFLYNTLESISMKAELDHNYEVADMISRLGRLFRMTINYNRELIRVSKEVEYIENYIQLQRIRFPEMSFILDIKQEVLSSLMLPWIIQPLVENALIHGLAPLNNEGWIRIEASKLNEDLYIRIIDNGVGIEEGKRRDIQSHLLTDANKEDDEIHIGLKNIYDRIRHYYGEGYGLTVQSEPGQGTTVEIRMKYMTDASTSIAYQDEY